MGNGAEETGGGYRELRMTQEERDHMNKVACYVATDGNVELAESILLRLLRITKNYRRWGFLSPDHPHHPYYMQRRVSEQCRARRPPS